MDKKVSLEILKGIVATHTEYQKVASDLKSADPEKFQLALNNIVLKSTELDHLDILTLAYEAGGDLKYIKVTRLSKAWTVSNNAVDLAAHKNSLKSLKFLTKHGADLEVRDEDGQTPAHGAAMDHNLDCLMFLAEQGVDLEARNNEGMTPTHEAAEFNSLDCLIFLANQHVDLESRDNNGWTPAHSAGFSCSLDCLKYLAERGVDLEARNNSGQTPSHLASEEGNMSIVKFIEDYLAKKNQEDQSS